MHDLAVATGAASYRRAAAVWSRLFRCACVARWLCDTVAQPGAMAAAATTETVTVEERLAELCVALGSGDSGLQLEAARDIRSMLSEGTYALLGPDPWRVQR